MDENKLIDKLIFYASYLDTLAKQGEHLLKDNILTQITLAREYILKAKDKLKELKESKGTKIFDQILLNRIFIEKYNRIKCPCSEEYINRVNCHYCEFNTKEQDENYIICNYNK